MKTAFTRSLYLSDPDDLEMIKEAELIALREQWSFNRLVAEALHEFVRRHKEGNVSFQLDKYGISWTRAEPVDDRKICAVPRCKEPSLHTVIGPKGKTLHCCKVHLSRFLDSDKWRLKQ